MSSRDDKEPYVVDGTVRCGATTVDGGRCKKFPLSGASKCHKHGGRAAIANRGAGNPNYRHGRYMASPMVGFVDRMESLLSDGQLRNLNSEIALITYRLEQLLSTTGNPGESWLKAQEIHVQIWQALQSGDNNGIVEGMQEMGSLIDGNSAAHSSWMEIYGAVELRRKLTDSAHRQEMQAGLMLSATEWATGAQKLIDATRRVVRILIDSPGQYDYDTAMLLVTDEFDTQIGGNMALLGEEG